jgi:hypothetical protein
MRLMWKAFEVISIDRNLMCFYRRRNGVVASVSIGMKFDGKQLVLG